MALMGKNPSDPLMVAALTQQFMPAIVLLCAVGSCLSLFVYARYQLSELWSSPEESGLKRVPLSSLAPAGLAGLLLALVAFVLVNLFPPPSDFQAGPLVTTASSGLLGALCWSILAVGIAPVAEEILYRGVLFTGLARRVGTYWAGLLVTIVFVLCHWGEAGGYSPALLGIAGLATATLVFRVRSGSIVPSIVCHLAYNSFLAVTVLSGVLFPSWESQAIEHLTNEDYPAAVQAMNEAIEDEPTRAELYLIRASARSETNDLDGALDDYERALDLKIERLAATQNGMAYTLAKVGRYQEAVPLIEAALTLEPDNVSFLDTMGYVKVGLGDFQGALAAYDKALERSPEMSVALFGKAVCLERLGRDKEAKDFYTDAALEDPDLHLEWTPAVSGMP